jgi:hypothetical protein
MDLGDGRTPLTQQIRVAIYSKVAKEKISRWLRIRADIRPRTGDGDSVTMYSPPFYSLSKLNTTMMAKGIFEKDPTTGLIKMVVDAKNYLMREDGPARGPVHPHPPQHMPISYGAMADAAAAGLIRASIAARLELAELQGVNGNVYERNGDASGGPYHQEQYLGQYLQSPYENVQGQGHSSSYMPPLPHSSIIHPMQSNRGQKRSSGTGRGGRAFDVGLLNQAYGHSGATFENYSLSTEHFEAQDNGSGEGRDANSQKIISGRQDLGGLGLLVAGSDLSEAQDNASLTDALQQEGLLQQQIQQTHMQRLQFQMQHQQQQQTQQQQMHHIQNQHMQQQHLQQQQQHQHQQRQQQQMASYYDQRIIQQSQGQYQHQEPQDSTQEPKRQFLQPPLPMNHHLQQHQHVQMQMRGNNFASFDLMPYSSPSVMHSNPYHQVDQTNGQNNQLYQLQLQRQHMIQAQDESQEKHHQQHMMQNQFQLHPQQHLELRQLDQIGQQVGQAHTGNLQPNLESTGEGASLNFQAGILRLGDQVTTIHHRESPMVASARQYVQAHVERAESHAIDRHRERREQSMNLLRGKAFESRDSRDQTSFGDLQYSQEEAEERQRQHQLYMLMFPTPNTVKSDQPPAQQVNIGGLDPASGSLAPFSQESQGSAPEADNSFSQTQLSQPQLSQQGDATTSAQL